MPLPDSIGGRRGGNKKKTRREERLCRKRTEKQVSHGRAAINILVDGQKLSALVPAPLPTHLHTRIDDHGQGTDQHEQIDARLVEKAEPAVMG